MPLQLEIDGKPLIVYPPGFDSMMENATKRNRALTLWALCRLELLQVTESEPPPTQQMILEEVKALQKELGWPVYGNSGYQIQKNLTILERDHHVVRKVAKRQYTGRGRGGPTSPWMSVYIFPYIKKLLTTEINN